VQSWHVAASEHVSLAGALYSATPLLSTAHLHCPYVPQGQAVCLDAGLERMMLVFMDLPTGYWLLEETDGGTTAHATICA